MKKVILILIILILILIVGVGFYFASKPKELSQKEKDAAYAKILGRDANLNPDVKTGNVNYNGKYVTFSYPAAAKVYKYVDPDSKKNAYIKERFSFNIKNPKLVLNYTAESDQGVVKTLNDYPAVKMRKDKSFGYTQADLDSDGTSGIAFSRDRSGEADAEKTMFFLKDGMIYSISITGSNLDDVSDLFNTIASSFKFR